MVFVVEAVILHGIQHKSRANGGRTVGSALQLPSTSNPCLPTWTLDVESISTDATYGDDDGAAVGAYLCTSGDGVYRVD
jgi:hypothetical protein